MSSPSFSSINYQSTNINAEFRRAGLGVPLPLDGCSRLGRKKVDGAVLESS
jgi:hypothetical protein